MLHEVEVDGFKSLRDFKFEIRPGLNVLVGPNGSGKSNIVLFFEFLSHLCSATAMYATSRVGGAGAIFSMIGKEKRQSELSFSIKGSTEFRSRYKRQDKTATLEYNYNATIELVEQLSTLGFRCQTLTIYKKTDNSDDSTTTPLISIKWQSDGVNHELVEAYVSDKELVRQPYLLGPGESERMDLRAILSQGFIEELRDNSIFFSLPRFLDPVDIIRDDLLQGRAYNIDPNKVRQLEDIATEPGINFDGSGLAATLYRLKATTRNRDRSVRIVGIRTSILKSYPKNLLSRLQEYSKLVNGNIKELDVKIDTFENKIKISLIMGAIADGKPQDLPIPISLASDGMVKWLALTTAILSSMSAFAIEEPENFLHPYMQKEIVDIVRGHCQSRKDAMFALMTTHSETLINALAPEEVIVVSMREGRTHAHRPCNAIELNQQIEETGFGLGFYYVTGALND